MKLIKTLFNLMFHRVFVVAIMLLLQVALFVAGVMFLGNLAVYIYAFFEVVSLMVVIGIVSKDEKSDYKMTWIFAIMAFPLVGGIFYLIFANKYVSKQIRDEMDATEREMAHYLPSTAPIPNNADALLLSQYIYNITGFPAYAGTTSTYFPLGEGMYQQMLHQLENAKNYILMEYFIVHPGKMWDGIFEILCRKVQEGVKVYFMYDDVGSINTMPVEWILRIRNAGIHQCIFNPLRPRMNVLLNNRDHRKILVVDGETAFCGGINLADEYINQYERFGHWKDTGVMLQGDAAWPFVLMFLQLWRSASRQTLAIDDFRPKACSRKGDGLVQGFGDSPLDQFNVSEVCYLNAITRAKKYVYITTPYLVIDYAMEQSLCSAASAGVDVRVITPMQYDKWYVHMLTQSHYEKLVRAGVKIYEYTPGFMHGKMFVADDEVCMVGTCNMDFRSFHLHFECSALFYGGQIVQDVKQDILDCQKICQQIRLEDVQNPPFHIKVMRALLKILAPLM